VERQASNYGRALMVSSPAPADARTSWPVVLLVVGAGVVAAFQIGKAPAALPVLRADLGLSLVAAGWVISMFNVIGIALGMLIGAFADRVGHRKIVLAGLGLVALASLAGAGAQGAVTLLASRFCEGLGFMMVVVAAPNLIMRAARPADLKLAFGAWGTYMPAGTATMMALSPLLMAPFGWRGLWIANAVLVVLFAVALFWTTRPLAGRRPAPGKPASIARDILDTIRAPGPPVLGLAFATYTLQYLAVLGFLPTILVEREGLSQAAAAILTAIAIAANVPGNLVGGVLLHRGVPRWSLVAGASVAMALCGIGIYQGDLPLGLRYGLCVTFSLVCGILPASVLGGAPVHAPRPQLVATTNGLIMQGSNLGQTIGPPAIAALAAQVGDWHLSPLVLSASAALGVALAFVLRALERNAPAR
jgi:MFS family permease